MTASALDAIPGLGETRRKALVTHFGSVARLRHASIEEITAVPGIGVSHGGRSARSSKRGVRPGRAAPRQPNRSARNGLLDR